MQTEKKLITLVDDDLTNLFVGQSVLDEKYTVATALSAKHLFSFLENNAPVLILLDVETPKMDGFETITILKKKPETMSIPVIFLSSHNEAMYRSLGFGLGAVDYIIKPYKSSMLLERIEAQLAHINDERVQTKEKQKCG